MTAPTRSRLLGLLTVAAVTTGLLGGCTGGSSAPDPTSGASSTGVASPSASPEPTVVAEAPQWTDAMDQVSVDGALAVGQYFLELFPYVHSTGDTTTWRALSHPDCLFCADVADDAEHPPEGGFDDASVEIEPLDGVELEPGSSYSLTYTMRFVSESDPAGEVDAVTMIVIREDDRWLVRGVDVVPADDTDA